VSFIAYERSTLVTSEKYIGLDVHQATISVAVMDTSGKLVMESILETKASTLLQFLAGLRGNLSVTFEEGTWSAWLYDVLKPHVTHLVVVVRQNSKRHVPCGLNPCDRSGKTCQYKSGRSRVGRRQQFGDPNRIGDENLPDSAAIRS
jgi:hypothetical protein